MSLTADITTGDDVAIGITLKKDGAIFAINTSADVKAALISQNKRETHINAVSVSNAAPGSDWDKSLVVVEFNSASTSAIPPGDALIELQVDDNGKLTWFVTVSIEKGTIA